MLHAFDHGSAEPLTSRLTGRIGHEARDRGRWLLASAYVVIEECTRDQVKAHVEEGAWCRVTLSWSDEELLFSCTCRAYRATLECCEHVWATLLAAEREGGLDAVGEQRSVPLLPRDRYFRHAGGQSAAGDDPAPGEILYVLDRERILACGDFAVEIWQRNAGGEGESLLPLPLRGIAIESLPDPDDQAVGYFLIEQAILRRARGLDEREPASNTFVLDPAATDTVLPYLLESDRLFCRDPEAPGALRAVGLEGGGPWSLRMEVREGPGGECWEVTGFLQRGGEERAAAEPELVFGGGWVLSRGLLSQVAVPCPVGESPLLRDRVFQWLSTLRRQGGVFRVPKAKEVGLLERLWTLPRAVRIAWPDALELERTSPAPLPLLRVTRNERDPRAPAHLRAVLAFFYDTEVIEYVRRETEVPDIARRRLLARDAEAEARHRRVLAEIAETAQGGLGTPPLELIRRGIFEPGELELVPDLLPLAVRRLIARGWHVEAEGKLYRPPRKFAVAVSSGIDWFGLTVEATYGESPVPFPKLLRAMRSGREYVVLDDGTLGVLPETWLEEYNHLMATGRLREGRLRFRKCQVALLDRLVAAADEVTCDAGFEAARSALRDFEGLSAEEAGGEFRGELRPYQKEGLAWLRFLARIGLGGCLADDMGLGKTIQALAFLEGRRSEAVPSRAERAKAPPGKRPALVVVPRSLVFNWIAEARRFTPLLRVLDHTGSARVRKRAHLESFDLVITTYGTLVRDIDFLKKCRFDCAILDEAQAIKNPSTTYARAARLLKASHRIALTGTPIENHLGELWSLFEFLDPGLLGTAGSWKKLADSEKNAETVRCLSRALRPVILRRTKREVAEDLPERVEQTIFCELEAGQRKEYDDLRRYYRGRILAERQTESGGNIEVLQALLRLRQAACHPGLLDRSRLEESSSKLNVLLEQLSEIVEEGNKALVFSQFTALLKIVRRELEARGIAYAYLDGRTRRRAERVECFQTDPDLKLFLISLKAGGVGLNLTAAGYAFLLDPWWNPATEAQAIDRAHRIGQTRTVFAYRLIARGTIEERILELQEKKRRLAEEILGGERSFLGALKREDLEHLLS